MSYENDDEEEGIDLSLRKLIHSEGFVLSDEVKEEESGTWIKVDFFDSIMELLRKFNLIGGKE
tara:strand:+ start:604 stop:792 length:189 start_codon:yes stop_codon:yes gene_type:complete